MGRPGLPFDKASIDIINRLQEEGAIIKAYDPQAMRVAQRVLKDVEFCKDPYEVADGSDALVICTEWDEFKELDLDRIRKLLTHPIMIDGRNIFDPDEMDRKGFLYKSVGR